MFTDGSATNASQPFGRAAWGRLNATTASVVSMGHGPGLQKTSDRVEILAVLCALEWQCHFHAVVHLWIDSKFVVDSLAYLMQFGVTGDWAHIGLWHQIKLLLQQIGPNALTPHWIPSHLDGTQMEFPFEDWVRCWNDRIDTAVGCYF